MYLKVPNNISVIFTKYTLLPAPKRNINSFSNNERQVTLVKVQSYVKVDGSFCSIDPVGNLRSENGELSISTGRGQRWS